MFTEEDIVSTARLVNEAAYRLFATSMHFRSEPPPRYSWEDMDLDRKAFILVRVRFELQNLLETEQVITDDSFFDIMKSLRDKNLPVSFKELMVYMYFAEMFSSITYLSRLYQVRHQYI